MQNALGGSAVADVQPDDLHDLEERLQTDLGSRVRNITLQAWDGGVIIRGTAHTYHAKQLAQHAVMAATGYRIVANEIEVL